MPETAHSITIRRAHPDELDWINARYADIDFVPSTEADIVMIAEVDAVRAGLGRLVHVDHASAELGGMYVFDGFKGYGLARRIIAALLEASGYQAVYCLPFAELESLYESMGFSRTNDAPKAVADKHRWCNEHYPKPVLLMRRGA